MFIGDQYLSILHTLFRASPACVIRFGFHVQRPCGDKVMDSSYLNDNHDPVALTILNGVITWTCLTTV